MPVTEQQFTKVFPQGRPARFAGDQQSMSVFADNCLYYLHATGLASPLDSLDGNELRPVHLPSWYLRTAALCSLSVAENTCEPSPRETAAEVAEPARFRSAAVAWITVVTQ